MKDLKAILAATVVFGVMALTAYGAKVKTPGELLQEGIYAEETEGNLDEAIEKYEQVLDNERAYLRTAAQATYRIGMCYLKKGEKDTAGKYFREVVDKYPRQRSVVSLAQAELEKFGLKGVGAGKVSGALDVAERFLAAAIAGKEAEARELVRPGDAVNEQISDFQKVQYLEPLKILSMYADEKLAFAMTTEIVADHGRKGILLIRLQNEGGRWLVVDVDVEDLQSAREEMDNFLKRHPDVTKLAPGADVSLYDELPAAVINYIGGKYGVTCAEAGVKQMYANGRIYYVNNEFVVKQGGMGYYYNVTGQPAKGRLKLGGTSYPNQTHYDVAGRKMDTEIVPAPGRKDHYHIYWTPKEPIAPGQFFSYGWSLHEAGKLSPMPGADKYMLIMQNHLGTRGVETFFLVIPGGMTIESQTTHWTGNATFAGHEVYWWTDEVQPDTNHVVNVVLGQPVVVAKKVSAADKLRSENLSQEGWALWQQRKLAEAEAKFKEAVELDPKNENGWQGLGWAQFNQGKSLNAKDSFEKCIALNPKNSAALNGLGWIANAKGDKDAAIKWWEKAVDAQPGATASLSGLTQVYMERGDYEKAAKYYRMWLKAEPDNKDAKEGLEKAEKMSKEK